MYTAKINGGITSRHNEVVAMTTSISYLSLNTNLSEPFLGGDYT